MSSLVVGEGQPAELQPGRRVNGGPGTEQGTVELRARGQCADERRGPGRLPGQHLVPGYGLQFRVPVTLSHGSPSGQRGSPAARPPPGTRRTRPGPGRAW